MRCGRGNNGQSIELIYERMVGDDMSHTRMKTGTLAAAEGPYYNTTVSRVGKGLWGTGNWTETTGLRSDPDKSQKKSCPARKQEVGRPWGRENSFCLFKEQQAVREPAAEATRKEGSSPPACCAHITLNIVFHSTPRMAALNQDLFFSFRSNPQPDWEITFVWINYLITFITHDFKNCLAFNSRQLPLPLKTD